MKKISLLILLVGLVRIALLGQSVKIKADNDVDMTKYESFTVMKGEIMTPRDERKMDEEVLFSSIKKAVIKEMELRGYKFLADSSAQLYVSYVAGAYDLTEGGSMGPLSQMPASTPSDMNQSRSWSRESREGMMVIDITDAHSKKEIWSATGNLTLDGVDISRALDAVIYKAFKKFPNKNKKKKK
ncbi:MAG: DUF4136 domain-containing protein [Cyclobacteriaceae bacterium]|jgi:hypothetical protein|nr:DUF4136 domain-containing protein [Cyclobacteriaceae bacterium]MDH4296610.1 DUF4136 domain-containing protein [Cyclobacteriaceae bacterium]MDH5248526.1 DUF4136 domain-containing protein [Cyclobacteriaceae bacterium]